MLKDYLRANNIKAKDIAEKTGYNKNTITNWIKLDSDEKFPQDFILKLLELYPDTDLTKYFSTHHKILKAATLVNRGSYGANVKK